MVIGYFLKADIKHYFDTVDHEILLNMIKKRISDEKVLWLIKRILENNTKLELKGMPIGNLTSQFFANVYLNELDYFVKHKLKAKYYLRYVDDFVILHNNKKILEDYKEQIEIFLKTIKLEIHPEKSKIYSLHKGVNLLGYRIFYHYRLLRKSSLRKFQKRLEKLLTQYKVGEIDCDKISSSITGWNGYAIWANTYKLRQTILKLCSGF